MLVDPWRPGGVQRLLVRMLPGSACQPMRRERRDEGSAKEKPGGGEDEEVAGRSVEEAPDGAGDAGEAWIER